MSESVTQSGKSTSSTGFYCVETAFWIEAAPQLSVAAQSLFHLLCRYSRANGNCFWEHGGKLVGPSQVKLATVLGIDRKTLRKSLGTLTELGIIEAVRTGHKTTTLYRVLRYRHGLKPNKTERKHEESAPTPMGQHGESAPMLATEHGESAPTPIAGMGNSHPSNMRNPHPSNMGNSHPHTRSNNKRFKTRKLLQQLKVSFDDSWRKEELPAVRYWLGLLGGLQGTPQWWLKVAIGLQCGDPEIREFLRERVERLIPRPVSELEQLLNGGEKIKSPAKWLQTALAREFHPTGASYLEIVETLAHEAHVKSEDVSPPPKIGSEKLAQVYRNFQALRSAITGSLGRTDPFRLATAHAGWKVAGYREVSDRLFAAIQAIVTKSAIERGWKTGPLPFDEAVETWLRSRLDAPVTTGALAGYRLGEAAEFEFARQGITEESARQASEQEDRLKSPL